MEVTKWLSAVVELFLGDMGSIQRETRPSIQREDQLTMETKLEQIAASAVKQLPKSVGAGNPHATFCGNRGRATASGDPVERNHRSLNRAGSAARKSALDPNGARSSADVLEPFVKALHYAGRTGRGRPRILRDGP